VRLYTRIRRVRRARVDDDNNIIIEITRALRELSERVPAYILLASRAYYCRTQSSSPTPTASTPIVVFAAAADPGTTVTKAGATGPYV